MRAMILAAGRGLRMGSLTKNTPKSLLKVGKKHLIEYSIESLVNIGITEIVINISFQREMIKQTLGNGERYGAKLFFSEEETPLETGGGIYQALPLLGNEPFIVLSSDIITHFPLHALPKQPEKLAHVVLVDNPDYHPKGDFALQNKEVTLEGSPMLTFSNISVLTPALFKNCNPGHFRLGDLLKSAVASGQVTGEHSQHLWFNLGTPSELEKASSAIE
jgi:MurNAc alpha-1-phosphate uridylyltransferase